MFEIVDPDAMDKLFHDFGEPDDRSVTVSFSMLGYDIELHGDGRVYIDGDLYVPDSSSAESSVDAPTVNGE